MIWTAYAGSVRSDRARGAPRAFHAPVLLCAARPPHESAWALPAHVSLPRLCFFDLALLPFDVTFSSLLYIFKWFEPFNIWISFKINAIRWQTQKFRP
jgi:hypothetical protein